MGKTALAGSIALYAAKRGVPTAFESLEMQSHELANRLLAIEANIAGDKARRGELDAGEFERYRQAGDRLREIPLEIDDGHGLTVEMIMARIRALHRRGKCDLAIIDYLGLIRATSTRPNKVEQIEHQTVSLQGLAKQLDIPILLLAQVNRGPEARDDKRPGLADLRSSGAIEQDAEAVFFIYRHEITLAGQEPKGGGTKEKDAAERADWEDKVTKARGKAEIIVAKNRHGPAHQTIHVAFNGETSGFLDLPDPNVPPPYSDKDLYGVT